MLAVFTLLVLQASFLCGSTKAAINSALVPTPRDFPTNWMAQHNANVAVAKRGGVDILFIGDSITAGWAWRTGGRLLWDKDYAPRHAANFGIGWDRIQNVLWRVENGELDGIHPHEVILLIGTNNTGNEDNGRPRNSPGEIVEGIENLVQQIQTRLPGARILLFGLFPRGESKDPVREQVKAVNAQLEKWAPGHVEFLDIGNRFLEPDGTLPRSMFPDLLHPNARGYAIWSNAIDAALAISEP